MASKNNIRSIRFSDELADLIDRQVGESFTAKFEGLITRCVWELPQKEQELKLLDKMIGEKRQQLQKLSSKAAELNRSIFSIEKLHLDLDRAVKRAVNDLES